MKVNTEFEFFNLRFQRHSFYFWRLPFLQVTGNSQYSLKGSEYCHVKIHFYISVSARILKKSPAQIRNKTGVTAQGG